jgi:hypothetical protein
VHPGTNEITRDLDAARFSIDLLGMLETKTRGNLSPDEERLLAQVLTTLRLNFVEEAARKPAPSTEKPASGSTGAPPAADEPAGERAGAGPAADGSGSAGEARATDQAESERAKESG